MISTHKFFPLAVTLTNKARKRKQEVRVIPTEKGIAFRTLNGSLIWNYDKVPAATMTQFRKWAHEELDAMYKPKRNPQPKKKNAYSHSKNIVSFYGSEIKGVSFVDRGKGLAVIVHVDDRTKIHLGDNSPRVNGRSINGNEIVEALIEKYVK